MVSRSAAVFAVFVMAMVLASSAGFACSSNGDDSGTNKTCAAYAVPDETDLSTPTISFASDVVPLFQKHCSEAACHGANRAPVVGAAVGIGDPKAIRARLVGVAAVALSSAVYVAAGDPTNSFLMHKIDGDACLRNSECIQGTCGDTMPDDGALLSVVDRDVVRRWIAQGAIKN